MNPPPNPRRVQLKRTKGWRKPEGCISVARPTKWGNPFWHTQRFYGLDLSLALYRNLAQGVWDPTIVEHVANASIPYVDHQEWLKRLSRHPIEAARDELAGHDLACWCPLDQPCHADVLLELANPGRGLGEPPPTRETKERRL